MNKMKILIEKISVYEHGTGKLLGEHNYDPPLEYGYLEGEDNKIKFMPVEISLEGTKVGTYDLFDL